MTNEEAKKILKATLECYKRDISGKDIDCNCRRCDECKLNYEHGNMGEKIEALDIAINSLEQIPSIPDVENNYNIGYNCGYADAMFDISESEE